MPLMNFDRGEHHPIPPALDHLQHSNSVPLDAEADVILDVLATSGDKAEVTSASHTVRSPLRRLPADILSEIFIECDNLDLFTQSLNTRKAPWTFTYVCQEWRRVAISTSQLWSFTRISLDARSRFHPLHPGILLMLLSLHLERSGCLPLEVDICFGYSKCHHVWQLVLEKLIEHSDRWAKIYVQIDYLCHLSFNSLKGRSLTMLQTIEIDNLDDRHGEVNWSLEAFNDAPRLQHVTIRSCSLARTLRTATIITYDLTGHSVPICAILSDMPLLENLTLRGNKYWDATPLTLVHHSNLRSLELDDFGPLAYLKLPALEGLDLTHLGVGDCITAIASLIRRSSCSLKTLSVYLPFDMLDEDPDYVNFYRKLPSLVSLSMGGLSASHLPLIACPLIASSPQSLVLLPKLTSISIAIEPPFDDEVLTPEEQDAFYHRFIDMVRSRVPPHVEGEGPKDAARPFAYLREIRCHVSPDIRSVALFDLVSLKDREVDVTIQVRDFD